MHQFWNYTQEQRTYEKGKFTVYPYERGLLYEKGAFVRELEAGRYRIWPWREQRAVVIDVRRASTSISNQKLLTSDQITVTLNLSADYLIKDVVLALHSVSDFRTQLYEDVQLRARDVVGAHTVDELLEKRAEINSQIFEGVRQLAEAYGLGLLQVGIKDIMLAPRVRDLLMKEVEARRVAQAMLIGAREEVAAMRALANAARLAADHPELLRLRELDAVRAFAGNAGNTVVWNTSGDKLSLVSTSKANRFNQTSVDDE